MSEYDSSGRTGEFNTGMSSLDQASERFNSQVTGFTPTSALDAYMLPGYHPSNGNSSTDAARQTPYGANPTMNGSSATTYDALTPAYKTRLAP